MPKFDPFSDGLPSIIRSACRSRACVCCTCSPWCVNAFICVRLWAIDHLVPHTRSCASMTVCLSFFGSGGLMAFLKSSTLSGAGGGGLSIFDAIEANDDENISWAEFLR